jgi:flagellar motor switch protein FliN
MSIEHETFDNAEVEADTEAETIDATRLVSMNVQIVIGRTKMGVQQILKLARGAVIELDRDVGDPVDVIVNDRPVARGQLVEVEGGKIGITLTEMLREHVKH